MEEASGPPVEVWPEHMVVCDVMRAMGTQWRVGMGGATGLDYAVLPQVFRLVGVPKKDWARVFDDLRVMECGVLTMKPKN